MYIVELNEIGYRPAGRAVLKSLSWNIGDRERIGLVGPNGAGKSSLMNIIAGEIEADDGFLSKKRDLRVGSLHQDVNLPPGTTLIEAAMVRPPALEEVEDELARIESQLADRAVYGDEGKLARALARQARILERYEELGGGAHPSRVRSMLGQLGFNEADYDLPVEVLSGGQKKLVALVSLAVATPGLLLLDEPDNHLDVTTKQHLETFIRAYPGSVVIVSHDRYLLDSAVDVIVELNHGSVEVYLGNYSAYTSERELRRLRQQQKFADQQKEVARIEASIARFELWASMVVNERHIKQARSRRKQLDRMEASDTWVEKVDADRQLRFSIAGGRGSRKALEVKGLTAAFDDDLIFEEIDLLVRHGERVGLVGRNGCGKSVLFRMILGELAPYEGSVTIGPSTRVGYYSQEHETLDKWMHRSPLEFVRDTAPMEEGAAVSLLMRFLFSYDQLRQPIENFSGGERSRLQLARIMLEKPNLLLLDEPTNNLDIGSVEVLESVLDDFEGAILTISHDRYFLDTVVDRVVAMGDEGLVGYAGGYTDYVAAAMP